MKRILKNLEKNDLFISEFSSKKVSLDSKNATFDRLKVDLGRFQKDLFIVKADLKKVDNVSVYALYEYKNATLKSFYVTEKKNDKVYLTAYGKDGNVVKEMITTEEEINIQNTQRHKELSEYVTDFQDSTVDDVQTGFWRSFFCSIYVGTGGIATCIGLGFATAGTAGIVCALIIGAGYGAIIC